MNRFVSIGGSGVLLLLATSAQGQETTNNLCLNRKGITCNQTLQNETIKLTKPKEKKTGDDPKGSLREDVWFLLNVPAGPSQFVTLRVNPGGNLKLSLGKYDGPCGSRIADKETDENNNMVQRDWVPTAQKMSQCLPPGDYHIVVDENRSSGEDKPTSNKFSIDVLCVDWEPGFATISVDSATCPLVLDGTAFRDSEVWAVHVIAGTISGGTAIPSRVPGSARWVMANSTGTLVTSDLETVLGEGGLSGSDTTAPAEIARSLASGTYSVILDEGDGVYNPADDYIVSPVEIISACSIPTGACCLIPDGGCVETTESICGTTTATYRGDDTVCDPLDRPCEVIPVGACCDAVLPDCQEVVLESDCGGPTDIWTEGQSCADVDCSICGNEIREPGEQCDGTDDAVCPGHCQADCACEPGTKIPTVSEWGLIVMGLMLFTVATVLIRWRQVGCGGTGPEAHSCK